MALSHFDTHKKKKKKKKKKEKKAYESTLAFSTSLISNNR